MELEKAPTSLSGSMFAEGPHCTLSLRGQICKGRTCPTKGLSVGEASKA